MDEANAACYELPFAYVLEHVKPERAKNNRSNYAKTWWIHGEARPTLRTRLKKITRVIVTPEVSKHRIFAWLPREVLPDKNLQVIVRDDDVTFGILSSHIHKIWALRQGSSLEDRPRYTPTSTFETFPFPVGLSPNIEAAKFASDERAQAISQSAKRLNDLRENWLNPPDLVIRTQECVQGYPDRLLPKDGGAKLELEKRTLTNLYNSNPSWLQHAHRFLDEAVAAAYGWEWPLTDDEVLGRLLELNLRRARPLDVRPRVQRSSKKGRK
jgi:type II restriction/modification system DNA methylase subunit YeeA